jgi:signal transduction histidine kinase
MDGALHRLWSGARSVRGRLTASAVAIVGVVVLIGAIVLVLFLDRSLTESVVADLRVRSDELAARLESGADPASLTAEDTDEVLVQVLDSDGRLIAASEEAGSDPLARIAIRDTASIEGDEGEPFLIYAAEGELPGQDGQVLVARSIRHIEETTSLVTTLLAIGIPMLLAVVAVVAWLLIGRALRPVERMRAEVDGISATELHRRVPPPPGDDEITRLATTMNRMLARLERSQQRQHQLVADTSHELRSPIATIRQHAEVALAHPEQSSLADLADTVLAEDLRLARLVDDLLILAQSDERTLVLDASPVDLDDLVMDEARRLRSSGSLEIDTTSVSAGRVSGDTGRLRRVVANLADNAAQHARRRVAFSLNEDGSTVRLRVDDDGPGIPEEDRERVFERFVRLDAARSRQDGGSGLGLAIVSELVRAHRGSVAIADGPLGGTRVDVVLPRLADA